MNAQWPFSIKTLSCELWILGAICWFGKTHVPDSVLFKSANFDQQLSEQLNCSVNNITHEFSKVTIESLDIPVNIGKALHGLSITSQDLFLLFLCAEIENNYWLNLAIQELQGPQDNPYPKVHLICELLSVLFIVRLNPTDICQHFFVREELLLIESNGPLALASVQVNKDIWLELLEPKSDQQLIRRIVTGAILESDLHSIYIQPLHNMQKHKTALDFFSLEFRLRKIIRLDLYAPVQQAMAFACQIAEMLDLCPVIPDPTLCAQPKKLFWFSRAFDWLPILLSDETPIPDTINVRSVVIATHKKSSASTIALMDSNQVAEYKIIKEDYVERFSIWSNWVGTDLADKLAKRWLMSSSIIPVIMKQVNLSRRLHNESLEDAILQARLDLAPESLSDLAIHLPQKIHHKSVVFPKLIDEELNRLLQRCRDRDDIFTGLGYSTAANQHNGVKALFSGESGTGKTLAASYIASQLGIPIYRMDLGSVLNKYIGETEKNITLVMDEACNQDFIILIDEADALFGKRTDDIGSGGERFANMLTNYLLSRIEQYSGIVLLTTNGMGRIDSAFMRRLDMIIEFNSPELEERTRIWQSHLGNRSPGEQYCRQLASLCDLTGGYIRNAVLAAAADLPYAKDSALPYSLLLRTLAAEYRKSGKPIPPKLAAQITATL
jgi:hypothetical protein